MPLVAPDDDVPVELSVLVVSYNTKTETLEALESLLQHPPPINFEVIVVDNASADGSYAAIAEAFPRFRVIDSPQNLGFAAANNLAAELARGRRLLLLNPDTITLPSSHVGLWNFAEREPGRGIWGGRTLFGDMSLNPSNCWRRMTLWSLFCAAFGLNFLFPASSFFNPESYGRWARDSVRDVDTVTGCFFLVDTSLWRRLEGFDPTFFMYAEEADLCLRAKTLGANPGVSPEAEIIHLGGRAEATTVDKVVKTARGRVTLMRKHWKAPAAAVGTGLWIVWAALRLLGSHVATGRRDAPGSSKDKWRQIWSRRKEWLAGYEPTIVAGPHES